MTAPLLPSPARFGVEPQPPEPPRGVAMSPEVGPMAAVLVGIGLWIAIAALVAITP